MQLCKAGKSRIQHQSEVKNITGKVHLPSKCQLENRNTIYCFPNQNFECCALHSINLLGSTMNCTAETGSIGLIAMTEPSPSYWSIQASFLTFLIIILFEIIKDSHEEQGGEVFYVENAYCAIVTAWKLHLLVTYTCVAKMCASIWNLRASKFWLALRVAILFTSSSPVCLHSQQLSIYHNNWLLRWR